ncbi:alpha/beta fold hydrolase [Streptacidiphilus sp. PB12-B1b]|uniref:alpha/beta fold hydrolase n=1 Tax=Streptacidiphilus sp. PB12-B1b TaxID=2705012 RepID=UPI0015F7A75C|nr:alpha/beta fold hydrolase [Streptacidiphilus sp. PB12-B1b]QMU76740.1 alpha/beta fold hydrolase [Streptacidiphilus sp. PB12-B1b]
MGTARTSSAAGALHHLRTGPRGGVPVVLLHPAGLDLGYWDRHIAALRPAYDVVALDLPGHGGSPGGPRDWPLERVTATVAAFLRGLGIPAAHVVGISVGGMIAQSLALAEPELVRSLVLIGTAASFSEEGRAAIRDRARQARTEGMEAMLPATFARWFTSQALTDRPELIDRATTTLLADDPQVHAAVWDMVAELDLAPRLGRIACPTLVLVGESDPSTPLAAARELTDGITGARLHTLPDASHLAPLERPELTIAHLLPFLAGQG